MTPARDCDGDGRTIADWENRLRGGPPGKVFSSSELEGLPEPVRRYLRTAIVPGTPLAACARLRMRGRIRVGRWLPFSAREVLNPLADRARRWRPRPQGEPTRAARCNELRPAAATRAFMDTVWPAAGLGYEIRHECRAG